MKIYDKHLLRGIKMSSSRFIFMLDGVSRYASVVYWIYADAIKICVNQESYYMLESMNDTERSAVIQYLKKVGMTE